MADQIPRLLFVTPLLALLATGCGSESRSNIPENGPPPPAAYETDRKFGSEWMETIERARVEEELVIVLGSSRSRDHRGILKAFSEKFGIKVVTTKGSSTDNVRRLLAERGRDRFTSDVILVSSISANRLSQSKALVPLEPLLLHPQVRDRSSGWMHTRQVWLGDEPGYIAAFRLTAKANISDIYFNSQRVSQEEIDSIRSWQDLLDERWQGRVVSVLDPNARLTTSHWHIPWLVLGNQWFDGFIRNVKPKLLPESAQQDLVNGLARGKYELAVFIPQSAGREIRRLGEVGLPVGRLTRTLDEGNLLQLRGAIAILDRAPHPKAAQLFVNWYLSREGQTAFHTLIDADDPDRSLRTDVPQGKVSDEVWTIAEGTHRRPNIRSDPELEHAELRESADFIKSICAELGCYGY